MKLLKFIMIALYMCFSPASPLFAADDATAAEGRPLSFGFRIEYYPVRFFDIATVTSTATTPAASYTYTASSNSAKYVVGPTVEYRWTRHLSAGLELHFHHTDYTQTTTLLSGEPPPTGFTDMRNTVTITQSSKLNYWELPLLAHYYGLRPHGRFARSYASGGVQYRYVGRIRTGNTYVYPDGTTNYNEIAPYPSLRNQFGFASGIGMRFLSDFRVRMAPEIRYVRWIGTTLQGPAYRSSQNQIEVGLGFSF
jgi:hypothetical protein